MNGWVPLVSAVGVLVAAMVGIWVFLWKVHKDFRDKAENLRNDIAWVNQDGGRIKRCVKRETAYLSIGDITHASRGGDPGKGTPSHERSYAGKQVEVQ